MAKPITIKITGDASGFNKAIGGVDSKLGSFSKSAGKALALGGAAFAGLAVGAGVALFKVGQDFDKAYDTIIVGTGASGEALDGLKDSLKNISKGTASPIEDIGVAVADLNTTMGLTGKPLEDMAKKMLDVTRLTGGDLKTNITNMSRVFGDSGVAMEDQGAAMDKLFFLSQSTGIGLDQLTSSMVSYGAPMRNFGFSMEESAALLAKFQKEGVNTEAVMAGMKAGLGKMAKAGEEPAEALARITEEIKNAGSAGEANALAVAAFGTRAGPDMAAAIREGRFEIDDLVKSLDNSGGSIEDAASRTESLGEKFTMFKNKVFLALEPIATKLFVGLGEAFTKMEPYILRFVEVAQEWLAVKLPPIIETLRLAFETIVAWVSEHWEEISTVITTVGDIITKVFDVIVAAVQWFVEVFKDGSTETDGETSKLMETFTRLKDAIVATFETVKEIITIVVAIVTKIWNKWGDEFTAVAKIVVGNVIDTINRLLAIVTDVMKLIKAVLTGDWSAAWEAIKGILGNVVGIIKDRLVAFKDAIVAVFGTLASDLKGKLGDGFNAALEFVKGLPGRFKDAGKALGQAIVDGLGEALDGITALGGKIGDGLIAAFKSAWNSAAQYINNKIPNKISVPLAPDIDLPDNPLPTFAMGGVSSGGWATVGERGREQVFLPGGARVVPNHASNGGAPITVNVATNADPYMIGREVAWTLKTAGV